MDKNADYEDLMCGGDVLTIAAGIVNQSWDAVAISRKLGDRSDLIQQVAEILLSIRAGKITYDPATKSKKKSDLYISTEDYADLMDGAGGDAWTTAFAAAEIAIQELDDDLCIDLGVDRTAKTIYRVIFAGKARKEPGRGRVWLGRIKHETGANVTFAGLVMSRARGLGMGNWMIQAPRTAREKQIESDGRLAEAMGGWGAAKDSDDTHSDDTHYQHHADGQDADADPADEFCNHAVTEFTAALFNPAHDDDVVQTPFQQLLEADKQGLAHLFGCTTRTIQNMRNRADDSQYLSKKAHKLEQTMKKGGR